MKKMSTKKMTTLAMFTALAVVLTLLLRVPLVPSVPFLTYDPKDVVIALGGFLFGPLSAMIVSMLSSGIELLFRGGNIIDWLMNVLSTCTLVCTAAFVYKKHHTKNGAFIGLLIGMAASILLMLAWNYVMDPIYFGMPQEAVNAMLPAIALFNFLKDSINIVLILLIYKPVVNALRHSGLVESESKAAKQSSDKKTFAVVGGFVLATIVVFLLTMIFRG